MLSFRSFPTWQIGELMDFFKITFSVNLTKQNVDQEISKRLAMRNMVSVILSTTVSINLLWPHLILGLNMDSNYCSISTRFVWNMDPRTKSQVFLRPWRVIFSRTLRLTKIFQNQQKLTEVNLFYSSGMTIFIICGYWEGAWILNLWAPVFW